MLTRDYKAKYAVNGGVNEGVKGGVGFSEGFHLLVVLGVQQDLLPY